MTHNYSVTTAVYDGSRGAVNPAINVVGTVDGLQYVFATDWAQIQQANSVGGSSAVRAVLGPLMLNTMILNRQLFTDSQQLPIPNYYWVAVPGPLGPSASAGWVSVVEATNCGSWTA
jgi:hypothetical protein